MTTAPVLNLSSAPDGFAEIVYESTRNAMPPLTVNQCPNHLVSNMFHNIEDVDDGAGMHMCLSWYCWWWVVPACDHKDRFVERQPRTTAQSTRLIMVDLVKYYVVFPVLAAFEEEEWDG
ncbi:hypothetical protein EJB05_13482, partial [Eragrostis curvula]